MKTIGDSFVGFSCFSLASKAIDSLLVALWLFTLVRTVYPENRAGKPVRCKRVQLITAPTPRHDNIAKCDSVVTFD